MLGSSNNTFYKNIKELKTIRKKIRVLLYIKERKMSDISDYLNAFDYFIGHPDKFDGATIVKDLEDIKGLDLDAMVHDYEYINGANRNFIKKWKADIKYIKNMERNGKGIRIFRLLLLTIIGIVFVPYCYFKFKLKNNKKYLHN